MQDTLEQAVSDLLRSVPETWADYDPIGLSQTREQALIQLVAAGMVERRADFRLRMFGHPTAVEATLTMTGEGGCVEAMELVAAGIWDRWHNEWQERVTGPAKEAPAFHCERAGTEQWRLTAEGIHARSSMEEGEPTALDFVLKRGFFDGKPRIMPDGQISQRLPVLGKGNLEKMKFVKADAAATNGPIDVNVVNMNDGCKAIAGIISAQFAQLAKPIAPDMPKDTAGWITVTKAAKEAKCDRGTITHACDSGDIEHVGTGEDRRINPRSLQKWADNLRRKRELKAVNEPAKPAQPQPLSGECMNCSEIVSLRDGKGQCPKCRSTNIKPIMPRRK